MKTGIELIAEERKEQLEKHHQTILDDVNQNPAGTLALGAVGLLTPEHYKPFTWDENRWQKMVAKPRKERIIIAAALLAAELDRLIYCENLEQQS